MAMIKIEHVQGGVTTEIPERDLAQYTRLGWRRYVESQPEPAPEPESTESDSVEEPKAPKRAKKSA